MGFNSPALTSIGLPGGVKLEMKMVRCCLITVRSAGVREVHVYVDRDSSNVRCRSESIWRLDAGWMPSCGSYAPRDGEVSICKEA